MRWAASLRGRLHPIRGSRGSHKGLWGAKVNLHGPVGLLPSYRSTSGPVLQPSSFLINHKMRRRSFATSIFRRPAKVPVQWLCRTCLMDAFRIDAALDLAAAVRGTNQSL